MSLTHVNEGPQVACECATEHSSSASIIHVPCRKFSLKTENPPCRKFINASQEISTYLTKQTLPLSKVLSHSRRMRVVRLPEQWRHYYHLGWIF